MNKDKAALLSIASNSLLIVFKLIAGILIGSISVISEAIHSSIDLVASFIAYISIKKASKKEDSDHPFGHGKYENVSGFTEAILIFFASALIIFEAVQKIIHGSNIERVGPGLIVMFISGVINLTISTILMKVSKKEESIALEADAMHLLTDVVATLGVFSGLLIVKFSHLSIIDPIAAILVALLIIKTSINLTKKSLIDLVDSSLSSEDIQKIIKIINCHPEVKSYHRLRTRRSGSKREIDIHLKISDEFSLVQAHNLCDTIEEEITLVFTNCYILIHAEPDYSISNTNNIKYKSIDS